MRLLAILAAFTVASGVEAQRAPEVRQLEVTLPVPPADAVARVQGAFADEGLAVTSATGNVVTASATDRVLQVRYSASVIPVDSTTSRIVLTAFATRPAIGAMPEAQAQVTSRSGGPGKAVWQRLERLHGALSPPESP